MVARSHTRPGQVLCNRVKRTDTSGTAQEKACTRKNEELSGGSANRLNVEQIRRRIETKKKLVLPIQSTLNPGCVHKILACAGQPAASQLNQVSHSTVMYRTVCKLPFPRSLMSPHQLFFRRLLCCMLHIFRLGQGHSVLHSAKEIAKPPPCFNQGI